MSDALNRWTNRVINVKLQELDVSQRRDQMILRYVEHSYSINTTKLTVPYQQCLQQMENSLYETR